MRSIAIVVSREFSQHALEVGLIKHDQVVKTLGPYAPHDPLPDGISPGRSWRRPHPFDTQSGQPLVKVATVVGIPVVD